MLTGVESVFVRISGCNLRCWFCDTPHASWNPESTRRSVTQIVDEVVSRKVSHAVITGGEPLLYAETTQLCNALAQASVHVTIETAATLWQAATCDLMSISPKLTASKPRQGTIAPKWIDQHESRRWRPDVILRLIKQATQFQLKFVVDQQAELDEVQSIVEALRGEVFPARVWVMPQARSVEELDRQQQWLIAECEKRGFQYCDRKHLRWFGNKRQT